MADEPNIEPAQTAADEAAAAAAQATEDSGQENSAPGDNTPGAEEPSGNASEDVSGDAGEQTGDNNQPATPESYADFKLPEGVTLDNATLEKASPVFKDLGLNQEQAQKLVDLQADLVQAGEQGRVESFNQLMNDWKEQSINDKEFGGDNFAENVAVAKTAIDKFGTPELSKLLEDHGVGNHPEVIRFMLKVGKLTQEDVPGGGNSVSNPQDRVSVLYPESKSA